MCVLPMPGSPSTLAFPWTWTQPCGLKATVMATKPLICGAHTRTKKRGGKRPGLDPSSARKRHRAGAAQGKCAAAAGVPSNASSSPRAGDRPSPPVAAGAKDCLKVGSSCRPTPNEALKTRCALRSATLHPRKAQVPRHGDCPAQGHPSPAPSEGHTWRKEDEEAGGSGGRQAGGVHDEKAAWPRLPGVCFPRIQECVAGWSRRSRAGSLPPSPLPRRFRQDLETGCVPRSRS